MHVLVLTIEWPHTWRYHSPVKLMMIAVVWEATLYFGVKIYWGFEKKILCPQFYNNSLRKKEDGSSETTVNLLTIDDVKTLKTAARMSNLACLNTIYTLIPCSSSHLVLGLTSILLHWRFSDNTFVCVTHVSPIRATCTHFRFEFDKPNNISKKVMQIMKLPIMQFRLFYWFLSH